MKKILSFALSLILCLMAISCVNNGGEADVTSASTTSNTTAGTTASTTAATTATPEPEKKPEPLLAGFSEKNITPKKLGIMPGGSSKQIAKKVVMPLLANAAAFESDGNSLIIVSIDILMFLDSHAELMRTRINEATGVPKENILIAGIIRERKTIIPSGDDVLLSGDKVVILAANQRINNLSDIIR